jgi:GTP cyclohydrolase I
MDTSKNLSQVIRERMKADNKRFWAGDNINEYVTGAVPALIDEAAEAFEKVLGTLLIDTENDPNSKGTAKRLAKMYYNELMAIKYIRDQGFPEFLRE